MKLLLLRGILIDISCGSGEGERERRSWERVKREIPFEGKAATKPTRGYKGADAARHSCELPLLPAPKWPLNVYPRGRVCKPTESANYRIWKPGRFYSHRKRPSVQNQQIML